MTRTLLDRRRRALGALIILVPLVSGSLACHREVDTSEPPPQSVTVAVARDADAGRTLRVSGSIDAERSTPLSFSIPGTIESVAVQEGDTVRAGQVVAKLGTRAYADSLGIAKARAAQAEDAYRRLEPMHRNRTIPDVKWVEVETGVEQARLSVSLAQKSMDDAVLRAPESGLVARRSAEPGMSAAPGIPVVTIIQTRTLLATAPVPESHVASVRKGQQAQVLVGALGRTFVGTVRDVAASADLLTRTYTVKIALPNPDGSLRVGMVTEVLLRQDHEGRGVVVPPSAVRLDENGRTCVYAVGEDDVVRRMPVEVAGFAAEGTALSGGLNAGTRVVTSGSPMLADGITVRVVDAPVSALAPGRD